MITEVDSFSRQIIDRLTESMAAAGDAGSGARSGGGAGGGGNVHSFQDLEEASGAPMSRDKFLKQLPQTVIK